MSAIFSPSVTYVKASIKSACITVNRKYHQRCQCVAELSWCKTQCDQDINCKGYVGRTGSWSDKCQIATSSACPRSKRCGKLDRGNLGALDKEGSFGDDYDGCFIKSSGMSIG